MGQREIDQEAYDDDSPRPPSFKHLDEKGDNGGNLRKGSIANAKIANPLADMTYDELMDDVDKFCQEKELMYAVEDFQKGALLAQKKGRFETIEMLSEDEKELIRREKTHRWRQPKMMYYMTSKVARSFTYQ